MTAPCLPHQFLQQLLRKIKLKPLRHKAWIKLKARILFAWS
jgi:hypothetical protein